MAILKTIKDGFWTFLTPRHTQQRRDKPFKAEVKPVPRAKDVRHAATPVPGPSKLTTGAPEDEWNPMTPTSNRLSTEPADFDGFGSGSPDFNATDNTKVDQDKDADLKGEYVLDYETQKAKIDVEAKQLRENGWSEEVVDVYSKISMRGYEPLLPKEWELDFPGYPTGLFTVKENAYIVPIGSSDFRAAYAFKKLTQLGPEFRDSVATLSRGTPSKRRPAEMIKNNVKAYYEWSCADANFDVSKDGNQLPLMVFDANPPGVSVETMELRMQKKIESLAEKWNALIRLPTTGASELYPDRASVEPPTEIDRKEFAIAPPTLYGVLTSGSTCALVFYNLQRPGAILPCAIFNFTQAKHDFWNAIAIAIFVIHVRDIMCDVRDDLRTAGLLDTEEMDGDEDFAPEEEE